MPRLFKINIASEADVRVYVTDDRAEADLIIYETTDEWAATESPIWYYTDVLGRAERTIYFTNARWEADLIVSKTNIQGEAGWVDRTKEDIL